MRIPVVLLALLFLAVLSPGWAETRRELKVHADRMDYDEARKTVRLVGHVRFESGDAVMTAPFARYHTETRIAEFQGGVKISQPGSTLVGSRMKVWYGEKRGVLTGNVRLLSEKVPGGQEGVPTVMTAREIEYRWEEGTGDARGGVKVRQGDRRAFADQARYDRHSQVIDLSGNVRFERGQDDWLTSDSARVDLAAETIVARGQVVGRFVLEQGRTGGDEAPPPSLSPPGALEPEIPVESVEAAPAEPLPGL